MVYVRLLAVALTICGIVPASASVGNESAVVDYLRPALKYVDGTARVYYAARCTAGNDALVFPTVDLKAPTPAATGITAVKQIFQDDPQVALTQDRSGMVRITIGNVSTTILQTPIRYLTLDPKEQYNPIPAVGAVESMPEVKAAERSLDLAKPLTFVNYIVAGTAEGQPHLPKQMRNVTVDEALDSIARTFRGIIMYGICQQASGRSLYQLRFIYGELPVANENSSGSPRLTEHSLVDGFPDPALALHHTAHHSGHSASNKS